MSHRFSSYDIEPVVAIKSCVVRTHSFDDAQHLAAANGGEALWALYGRHPEGLAVHIADFATAEDAGEIYAAITGNPSCAGTQLPAHSRNYDSVDAAYIFAGLLQQRAVARKCDRHFSILGAGELEDFGHLWVYAEDAARAIEALIDPDEYDRVGVFAYEHLNADDPLICALFAAHGRPVVDIVRSWCESTRIRIR